MRSGCACSIVHMNAQWHNIFVVVQCVGLGVVLKVIDFTIIFMTVLMTSFTTIFVTCI